MSLTLTDGTATKRALLLLFVLAVLPYLNALRAGFTLDDAENVVENPAVTGGLDIIHILAVPREPGAFYRPLTVLTWAINEKLTPGSAAGFHAVNILLHAGVTILVFACAMQLFRSGGIATIAAALFAVHPIHTEAVTSITGRAEVLAALFGLLALWGAARADAAPNRWSRCALQSFSLTSFSLALLSKENALTVLLLVPLFRVACRGEPFMRGVWNELRSLDWIPYVLCAGVFVALHSYVIAATGHPSAIVPLHNMLGSVSWTVRIRSALGVLWDHFGLLNVPLVLAADYSHAQVPIVSSWIDARFLAGMALVAAAAAVVARHPRAAVRFAVAFPFVALVVTADILFPIWTIKAERLLYFPSVGWVLLVAYGVDRLWCTQRYRRITVSALCLVVGLFAIRTWRRNWDWKDNLRLYRSMVLSAPESAKAQYIWGVVLLNDFADYDGAAARFRQAFAIYPAADAALALGLALEKKGLTEGAVGWYEKALAMRPEFGEAHVSLCAASLSNGRFEAAAAACRRGLRYHPTDTNLLKGLRASLVGMGAPDKGAEVLRRALALDGQDDDLRTYLGQLAMAVPGEQGRNEFDAH